VAELLPASAAAASKNIMSDVTLSIHNGKRLGKGCSIMDRIFGTGSGIARLWTLC
jgi:hypothetical protein